MIWRSTNANLLSFITSLEYGYLVTLTYPLLAPVTQRLTLTYELDLGILYITSPMPYQ